MLLNSTLATTKAYASIASARLNVPTPRVREGQLIGNAHVATAMIDLSDGLASDLGHICEKSQVGARIFARQLPVADENRVLARAAYADEWHFALFGGEDYELLFTVPASQANMLAEKITQSTGTRVTVIGEILPLSAGREFVLPDSCILPLEARSWDHFKK